MSTHSFARLDRAAVKAARVADEAETEVGFERERRAVPKARRAAGRRAAGRGSRRRLDPAPRPPDRQGSFRRPS